MFYNRSIVIADVLIEVTSNVPFSKKYKIFTTNSLNYTGDCCKLEIISCEPSSEGTRVYKEYTNWEIDIYGNYRVVIYNSIYNKVVGEMSITKDYKFACMKVFDENVSIFDDMFDVLMFFLFQIRLLFKPGINIHAAAIEYKNAGLLFSAPSKTGKTTHARLWEKYYNTRMINGDRPAIVLQDDKATVHGSPWSGTDIVYRTCEYPLKAIVLLEQSLKNLVEEVPRRNQLMEVLPRFIMPYYNEELTDLALYNIEKLLEIVPVYRLKCRPDKEAVDILKDQLGLLYE